MYKIILHKDAVKFYEKAEPKLRRKIADAIDSIGQNPYHHPNIKRLKGELSHLYRYRTGDVRILYEVHEDIITVRITDIDYRGGIYK